MNFQELLAKMQQLDQPVGEECGMMPPGAPMPAANEPPVAPPSMSINLNAQGMDNIEDLMKLVTKVNPEMGQSDLPPLPGMSAPPSIASIKPAMPPLKMLPDLDSEDDEVSKAQGDLDNDGDHDMDDHDMEKKDQEEDDEEESFANSPIGSQDEPEIKDFKAAIPDGDDLSKPKKSFSDKPYRGDNPMAAESTDLRSQIRADLQRRLNEAKKS